MPRISDGCRKPGLALRADRQRLPALARWFLAPIINGAPRDALSDTLEAVAKHLGKGVPADMR